MGKLLTTLQVLKSTADGDGARDFYGKLTEPREGWAGEIRNLVLAKKQVCLSPSIHRARERHFDRFVLPYFLPCLLFLASENLRPTEHFRERRRRRIEGISTHAGGCHPKLRRAGHLNANIWAQGRMDCRLGTIVYCMYVRSKKRNNSRPQRFGVRERWIVSCGGMK